MPCSCLDGIYVLVASIMLKGKHVKKALYQSFYYNGLTIFHGS